MPATADVRESISGSLELLASDFSLPEQLFRAADRLQRQHLQLLEVPVDHPLAATAHETAAQLAKVVRGLRDLAHLRQRAERSSPADES